MSRFVSAMVTGLVALVIGMGAPSDTVPIQRPMQPQPAKIVQSDPPPKREKKKPRRNAASLIRIFAYHVKSTHPIQWGYDLAEEFVGEDCISDNQIEEIGETLNAISWDYPRAEYGYDVARVVYQAFIIQASDTDCVVHNEAQLFGLLDTFAEVVQADILYEDILDRFGKVPVNLPDHIEDAVAEVLERQDKAGKVRALSLFCEGHQDVFTKFQGMHEGIVVSYLDEGLTCRRLAKAHPEEFYGGVEYAQQGLLQIGYDLRFTETIAAEGMRDLVIETASIGFGMAAEDACVAQAYVELLALNIATATGTPTQEIQVRESWVNEPAVPQSFFGYELTIADTVYIGTGLLL